MSQPEGAADLAPVQGALESAPGRVGEPRHRDAPLNHPALVVQILSEIDVLEVGAVLPLADRPVADRLRRQPAQRVVRLGAEGLEQHHPAQAAGHLAQQRRRVEPGVAEPLRLSEASLAQHRPGDHSHAPSRAPRRAAWRYASVARLFSHGRHPGGKGRCSTGTAPKPQISGVGRARATGHTQTSEPSREERREAHPAVAHPVPGADDGQAHE